MKGKLEEAMSKARFTKGEFYVEYRDFKELVRLPVTEFYKIAEIVPTHRIARVLEYKDLGELDGGEKRSFDIIPLYESSDANLLALPVVVRDVVDEETLRFVEMRDVLSHEPTKWRRYDLEPIRRLKDEGRELLGREVFVEEKRDGENVAIWMDEHDLIHIASHNMVEAGPDIVNRLQSTKQWKKIVEMLQIETGQYGAKWILYGELIKIGRSPTGIEGTHKESSWVMFDILDTAANRFINYNGVYQKGYDYKIPVVKLVGNYVAKSMDELVGFKQQWLRWAKKHHREGVCIKNFDEDIGQPFAKERIDLPKLNKVPKVEKSGVSLPDMPPERIQRALEHCYDQIVGNHPNITEGEMANLWKDKSIVMPILARHLASEAEEHHYRVPSSMYQIYLDADIEKIKSGPKE